MKWEYKRLTVFKTQGLEGLTTEFMEALNKLGDERWDLVSIIRVDVAGMWPDDRDVYVAFLKREKEL